jgi:hypothetical protein
VGGDPAVEQQNLGVGARTLDDSAPTGPDPQTHAAQQIERTSTKKKNTHTFTWRTA